MSEMFLKSHRGSSDKVSFDLTVGVLVNADGFGLEKSITDLNPEQKIVYSHLLVGKKYNLVKTIL